MLLTQVKWLFFDMGSTLIDETYSIPGWFARASAAVGGQISAQEIERGYVKGMAEYAPTIVGQIKPFGYQGNSAAPLYPSELDVPYPQAKPLLERLSKTYKIGVIANQSIGAQERMEGYGLTPYLAFLINSAVAGFSKPDPRIFLLALEKAGCLPREAVMIGDRLDNDIYPAKKLGMRTIRVRQGWATCQEPRSEEYEADVTVNTLAELGDVLCRPV